VQPQEEASWTQEPAMQESAVQEMPSEQSISVPEHEPPEQASPVVHASPSSHGAVFGVKTQLPFEQESVVQALLSLQVFDKLSADLAKAMCSIPAVKGVEFGSGFESARMRGSEMNDAFEKRGKNIVTKTNRAGGLSGGISNGMPIVLRVAIKPTASIGLEQDTVDLKTGKAAKVSIKGRHDPCIVPRAVPIVEAMAAIVLADHGIRSGIITRRLLK
jgi:chorismate synthase